MKLRTGSLGPSSSYLSRFKMLASLNSQHSLRSVVELNAFKPQDNLFCSFSLYAENQLSLPTITTLLPVLMLLSPCIQRVFDLLVLCHFVRLVLGTLLTECLAGFRNVHHVCKNAITIESQIFFLMFTFLMHSAFAG